MADERLLLIRFIALLQQLRVGQTLDTEQPPRRMPGISDICFRTRWKYHLSRRLCPHQRHRDMQVGRLGDWFHLHMGRFQPSLWRQMADERLLLIRFIALLQQLRVGQTLDTEQPPRHMPGHNHSCHNHSRRDHSRRDHSCHHSCHNHSRHNHCCLSFGRRTILASQRSLSS
jgi:hypothetical protein